MVRTGGSDLGNAHWYKSQVIETVREEARFANFSENHYFVRASVQAGSEGLVFVVSFHHIGRELTGVMEATAFSRFVSDEGPDDSGLVAERFSLCSPEPFAFTWQTVPAAIENSFGHWLDVSLAVALKEHGDRL